jgi:hypothetical protein
MLLETSGEAFALDSPETLHSPHADVVEHGVEHGTSAVPALAAGTVHMHLRIVGRLIGG